MKSWKWMVAADSAFSCDVALVKPPLDLRLGLLGWEVGGEMVWMMRMNGGGGPYPLTSAAGSQGKIWWAKVYADLQCFK